MIEKAVLGAVVLVAALGSTGATADFDSPCGTPDPGPLAPGRLMPLFDDTRQALLHAGHVVTVDVYWHVIHNGNTGKLDSNSIVASIGVLNDSFSGVSGGAATSFSFALEEITYTDHAIWYDSCDSPNVESEMKAALRKGGGADLNVYSCGIRNSGQYGWATYPWLFEQDPVNDGVVVLDQSVPGGSATPYNEGDTLTHEVGHWLGLYHTFEGGCDGSGDLVADTPPEQGPQNGCPIGADSCAGDGTDPIENFMDLTDDSCRFAFTVGQATRIDGLWDTYRATPTGCTSDVECDDGDFCNGAESCVEGACRTAQPTACDDGDPCTANVCQPTGCTNPPIDCAGAVPESQPDTPLTASLNENGSITLSWGPSCGSGDQTYAVFQGTLGAFASHEWVNCDTAGATSLTFPPAPDDNYFLVVPLSASREGSLGRQSDGRERPQGLDRCLPRAIENCR